MPKKPDFVRRDSSRYSKLGKKRKKLQKWRGAKGRHNKIRLKRKGYPVAPGVGYKAPRKEFGKIKGLTPVLVHNLNELESLDKSSIAVIARVGAKKKIEMLKKASDLGINVHNAGGKKK
jgi:large subunit ribosomal protein L32e